MRGYIATILLVAVRADVQRRGRMFAEISVHDINTYDGVDEKSGLMRRNLFGAKPGGQIAEPTMSCDPWYATALKKTGATLFYQMNEGLGTDLHAGGTACGGGVSLRYGDECEVAMGEIINGAQSNQPSLLPCSIPDDVTGGTRGDHAICFDGIDQYIRLPHLARIDASDDGYGEKTVDLWMKAKVVDSEPRTIFSLGHGNYTGINIFVQEISGKKKLRMFAWNKIASFVQNSTFGGNEDDQKAALECDIDTSQAYYVAFVFQKSKKGSHYTGYIKRPGKKSVEVCGKVDLPADAMLGHLGEGDEVPKIGGARKTTVAVNSLIEEAYFKGCIQWVSIYNKALSEKDLNIHVEAARGENKPSSTMPSSNKPSASTPISKKPISKTTKAEKPVNKK